MHKGDLLPHSFHYQVEARKKELIHSIFLGRGGSGGPRVVVSTAAFHARARGSVPSLGGLKETKMFLRHVSS